MRKNLHFNLGTAGMTHTVRRTFAFDSIDARIVESKHEESKEDQAGSGMHCCVLAALTWT